ncbi:unnamed protein product [Effrenium voratum]|uniref:Uncharacterized protein n=1 Tax=Effrenium voratum TaxID=2562239 RepID=A0AA36IA40_9DINO|nr:unnamed protein product [Effrenium voratum]CAJ1437279.1 unnamed protein product [Effrenium voratum]
MARLALLALLGSVEALDCNDQAGQKAAPSACCDAQRAWSQMEVAGGCGSAEDPLCSRAETLCQQCRSAIDTLRSAAESDGLELDQKLSNLGVGFLEMRCVLPERVSCHGLSDLSFLALLGAAGGLLLLGALGLVLFDQRALPCLAARLRENGAGAGGKAMGSQLPQTAGAPGPDALRLAAALPSGTAQLGHDPSAGLAPALVLRRIFVWIASVGVSARLALLAGYAALLQRDFLEVAAEMLLCLLPLIWCATGQRK